jgi:thioredoxin-like negative regulator of GroEL
MSRPIDLADPADAADALGREWLVACLCAAWCDTCRDYQAGFEALAARFPTAAFLWVDIETHADWADDVDVENFPTIYVMQGDAVRFFGPMLPYHSHLERSLESLLAATHHLPVDGADALPSLRELLSARAG